MSASGRMSSFTQQLVVPAAQSLIFLSHPTALWSKTHITLQKAKAGPRSGVMCTSSEKSSLHVPWLHWRGVLSWACSSVLGKRLIILVSEPVFLLSPGVRTIQQLPHKQSHGGAAPWKPHLRFLAAVQKSKPQADHLHDTKGEPASGNQIGSTDQQRPVTGFLPTFTSAFPDYSKIKGKRGLSGRSHGVGKAEPPSQPKSTAFISEGPITQGRSTYHSL